MGSIFAMMHPQAAAKDKEKTPLVASLEEEDDLIRKVRSRDLMDENWTCIALFSGHIPGCHACCFGDKGSLVATYC